MALMVFLLTPIAFIVDPKGDFIKRLLFPSDRIMISPAISWYPSALDKLPKLMTFL